MYLTGSACSAILEGAHAVLSYHLEYFLPSPTPPRLESGIESEVARSTIDVIAELPRLVPLRLLRALADLLWRDAEALGQCTRLAPRPATTGVGQPWRSCTATCGGAVKLHALPGG